MRVIFQFRPQEESLILPLQYNSMLQGLVYSLLAGTEVAAFLHDRGFGHGPRRYKLFTFSRLEGSYMLMGGECERSYSPDGQGVKSASSASGPVPDGFESGPRRPSSTTPAQSGAHAGGKPLPTVALPGRSGSDGQPFTSKHERMEFSARGSPGAEGRRSRGRYIRFSGRVRFTLSSPYQPVCHQAALRALQLGEVRLGDQVLEVETVRFEALPAFEPPVELLTRTPITVYSTVDRVDGSRFTYFFEPRSREFERLLAENLVRKWEALTDQQYEGPGVTVRWRGRARDHIVRFRDTVIKGYTGMFQVDGDRRLIRLGLESGFVSKNAQGFGFCDVAQRRVDGQGSAAKRGDEGHVY